MADFPLYKTAQWQAIRRIQLRRVPLCERCKARGVIRPATVCDHVTPHKGDSEAFWAGPFASLCESCHSSAKQSEETRGYRNDIGDDGFPTDPNHPYNREDRHGS